MKVITSKAEVKKLIEPCILNYIDGDDDAFVKNIHTALLQKKIKFPLLEYAAKEIWTAIPEKEHISITKRIMDLNEIGGNTIVGMMLQLRLPKHFKQSISKSTEYIIQGDQWYVCDIIGERVLGYALLTEPEETIPFLKKFAVHSDKWIVRSIGVATHYAVKKGLKKKYAAQLFQLLLSLSHTTDFHTKKGIGWAAKTISKFHPDIIANNKTILEQDDTIKQWFKTKINIGLSRSFKYATKYSS
jgi:3-methyladenine DNA glycosylase AlkD